MQLLLTLSCLICITLSTTLHEPAHQDHEEPKVAIDGYVNGYYTFLGHQFPVFLDKAHTAIHGIEIANKRTGIHSTYPHVESDSEAIAESSLLTNQQQDDMSMGSVAFAHQQKSIKHNSHELSSILGSSESDIEVFGHGHIHLNPIVQKNEEGAFHSDNNHAGHLMESQRIGSMRNMGSMNTDQTNVYSANSSPIQRIPGLRVFSQSNEDPFGTTGNLETGRTLSSIGSDRNVYNKNQNSFTRRANNADLSKFNQANFGKRTVTQRERSNVAPYPKYDMKEQASNHNIGLNQNQVISRNQNIGQTSYEDYSRVSSPNQASGGAITQKEIQTIFSNHPTSYATELGHTNDRLYSNLELNGRFGQTNSAWRSEGNAQMTSNPITDSIEEVFSNGRSINHHTSSVQNTGITDQNLHTSGSTNRGLVNSDRRVVAQEETRRSVTQPNFDHIHQTGYPNFFLDGDQGTVGHYDHESLLDMSQTNNRKGVMTQKKTEGTLIPYPNYYSQMPDIHNGNGYFDEAGYRASKVLNRGKSHSNAGWSENGGIHDGNVYFGGMSHGRDEINHDMATINQQENQETLVFNSESGGTAKTDNKQATPNQNRYISGNGYDGYTQRGQINPGDAEFPDNGGIGHDVSICDKNHHHILDSSGNIVGKAGQEKLSLDPENIREVFTERKIHQGSGVQEESTGVQTNYGGRDQIEYPNQINNQNIAGFESSKGKGYYGKEQVDSERGASSPQGIQNAVPEYETMGGPNFNHEIRNRNLYIREGGSNIPSEIRQVGPTEAATPQEEIEIPGVDSYNSAETVNQNGFGRISDGLGLNRRITGQTNYRTSPRTNQANIRGDSLSQEKTSGTIISYPNYGRLGKIISDSRVSGFVNQNQNQPEYIILPSNNAVHGLNTRFYPLPDSNEKMFLQSGSYGQYPIEGKLSSQIPLWGRLDYPLENRPAGEYIPQFRPKIQYPPQSGVNGGYFPQNINVRYPSQLGVNGLYHRQGEYPPLEIQYPSQSGINVQYSLLYGQYGQYPIENNRYLNTVLDGELSQGNQGSTPLSSRLKENESDHDITLANVEPEAEVTDEKTSGTESGNDHQEVEPKIDGINEATSDEHASSSMQLPSMTQMREEGPSESKKENLKFQTKETTQVGDSQTIKFTIRLPPKMITRNTITNLEKHTENNRILDERSMKTQQPGGKKGIQLIIDGPSSASNQGGGGGARVIDLPSRFGAQEVSKSVDSSQRSENNIAEMGTSISSGSTLGLGDETGTDKRDEDDGQKEATKVQIRNNISSEHSESEEIKSNLGTPQNEAEKVQVNSRDSGVDGSDKYQKPLAYNEDLVGIAVDEETNKSAEGSNGTSENDGVRDSTHVLDRRDIKTDGHKELVYSNQSYGGVQENIIGLSRRNTDSTNDVRLNSILENGNDKGLGVHIKYKGSNVYVTGNSNSWEDNEITERPGDESRNKQKVKLDHRGNFQPQLDLARNLL